MVVQRLHAQQEPAIRSDFSMLTGMVVQQRLSVVAGAAVLLGHIPAALGANVLA
jgi:hypothetical protein